MDSGASSGFNHGAGNFGVNNFGWDNTSLFSGFGSAGGQSADANQFGSIADPLPNSVRFLIELNESSLGILALSLIERTVFLVAVLLTQFAVFGLRLHWSVWAVLTGASDAETCCVFCLCRLAIEELPSESTVVDQKITSRLPRPHSHRVNGEITEGYVLSVGEGELQWVQYDGIERLRIHDDVRPVCLSDCLFFNSLPFLWTGLWRAQLIFYSVTRTCVQRRSDVWGHACIVLFLVGSQWSRGRLIF